MPNDTPDSGAPSAARQLVRDTLAYAGAAVSKSTIIPAGIHALAVVQSGGGLVPKVTGNQSNIPYASPGRRATNAPEFDLFPIVSALDTSVTWGTDTVGAANQTLTLVGIYDLAWIAAANGQGGTAHVVVDGIPSVQLMTTALDFTVLVADINASLAAGANATLVAGLSGLSIDVYGWDWSFTPQSTVAGNYGGHLEGDTSLIVVSRNTINQIGAQTVTEATSPRACASLAIPIRLNVSEGLRIHNDSGQSILAAGSVWFKQHS